jgi:hypothetical protein
VRRTAGAVAQVADQQHDPGDYQTQNSTKLMIISAYPQLLVPLPYQVIIVMSNLIVLPACRHGRHVARAHRLQRQGCRRLPDAGTGLRAYERLRMLTDWDSGASAVSGK